ncbi:hypothetical protein O181_068828 [Austropuccinia psidii MF-1]|uniref:Uncharacterized protein n=1 Tax=Austropuccinia psidii MF-1 TaxID=1389203 RepID=A0A9Q3EW05_9BASI|nr:hypothetical protein [Austropuccinia psidii MF-1]
MELIDYIDGIFIDVPSIPYYCITARLNTVFKGHASIGYTEMKEIHGRRNWSWWKSEIIQKDSNGTWIWQKTMSFQNENYSVEKDPYECCLRQSKRLKTTIPTNAQRQKKVYAIEKVQEEESPTEDSDSESMGDAIREKSDEEQDPREEFLVEYQEENPLEIQDIQLEAGMPQDTANKNLCKHTQDTPTKGMA